MKPTLLIRLSSPDHVPGLADRLAEGASWFLRDDGGVEIATLGPFLRDGRGRSPSESTVLLLVSTAGTEELGGPDVAHELEEILRSRARVASTDAKVFVLRVASAK